MAESETAIIVKDNRTSVLCRLAWIWFGVWRSRSARRVIAAWWCVRVGMAGLVSDGSGGCADRARVSRIG
ncbi:MAG: hypothetical protein QOG10_2239, partial [Kribbellaceae bacterium]|nr:hypothetical protein [Kribbellaceae bacterium]